MSSRHAVGELQVAVAGTYAGQARVAHVLRTATPTLSSETPRRAADAERIATGRRDSFLIPAEHVSPALAARVAGGGEPAVPRPASTVALVREAAGGPEVLLLRRPHRSSFAASAWVFPGGVVDPGDAGAGAVMAAADPDALAGRMGIPATDALGFLAAALREAWEETGILLAEPAPDVNAARAARQRLLADEITLPEALRRSGVRLDARGVVYIAHWITPEPEPRRYDTRFFLAPVPATARCDLIGDELTEARWMPPAAATEAYADGAIRLLPPTVHTLHRLAAYPTVREMVSALRDAPVRTILPVMRRDDRGVTIEIPPE